MLNPYSAYMQARDANRGGKRMPVGGFSGQGIEGSREDLMDRERRRGERVREFESYAGAHPGAGIGGTGDTGLSPTDAKGWGDLLERRAQYAFDTGQADRTSFAGYSGGTLGDDRGGRMRSTAMRGLAGASGSEGMTPFDLDNMQGVDMETRNRMGSARGMGDPMSRIFGSRTVEGGVAEARRLGLMPQFDEQSEIDVQRARGHAARRSMMTPMEQAAEGEDIADRFEIPAARRGAFADTEAAEILGQQKSHEFWRRGLPRMQQELALDEQLARTRGEAAGYDDTIRAGAARDVATTRAGAQTGAAGSAADARTRATAMQTLERMIRGFSERGDQTNARKYMEAYDKLAAQQPQGGGGAPGGAPGGGGGGMVLSQQQLQQVASENGWSMEQAMREAQSRGYTVR